MAEHHSLILGAACIGIQPVGIAILFTFWQPISGALFRPAATVMGRFHTRRMLILVSVLEYASAEPAPFRIVHNPPVAWGFEPCAGYVSKRQGIPQPVMPPEGQPQPTTHDVTKARLLPSRLGLVHRGEHGFDAVQLRAKVCLFDLFVLFYE